MSKGEKGRVRRKIPKTNQADTKPRKTENRQTQKQPPNDNNPVDTDVANFVASLGIPEHTRSLSKDKRNPTKAKKDVLKQPFAKKDLKNNRKTFTEEDTNSYNIPETEDKKDHEKVIKFTWKQTSGNDGTAGPELWYDVLDQVLEDVKSQAGKPPKNGVKSPLFSFLFCFTKFSYLTPKLEFFAPLYPDFFKF